MTTIPVPDTTSGGTAEALAERLLDASTGALELACIHLGHRLGYYTALTAGPLTSEGLAAATGTDERYAREWLEQQAVADLLEVVADDDDDATRRAFALPDHAATVLAERDSPIFLAPLAQLTVGVHAPIEALAAAFRSGDGVPYADYGRDLREGIADMNRAMFVNELGSAWFPAIADVHARLSADPPARVADLACGSGWSSISIARAYPRVMVDAFDLDPASAELARANVAGAGLGDRVRVFLQDASDPELTGSYDLVTIFEAVHDMARPVEALATTRRLLAEGGAVVVADERVADRFTAPGDLVERLMYGFSVLHCLAVGRDGHEHSAATGTVMRTSTLERYAAQAGFSSVEVLPVENDFWRFYRLRP